MWWHLCDIDIIQADRDAAITRNIINIEKMINWRDCKVESLI